MKVTDGLDSIVFGELLGDVELGAILLDEKEFEKPCKLETIELTEKVEGVDPVELDGDVEPLADVSEKNCLTFPIIVVAGAETFCATSGTSTPLSL